MVTSARLHEREDLVEPSVGVRFTDLDQPPQVRGLEPERVLVDYDVARA